MFTSLRPSFPLRVVALALALLAGSLFARPQAVAGEKKSDNGAQPALKGQRVFSAGHSFHVFVPGILNDLAKGADIKDHVAVGLSSIGGSRVIQHWNMPDEKNKGKQALQTGKVD